MVEPVEGDDEQAATMPSNPDRCEMIAKKVCEAAMLPQLTCDDKEVKHFATELDPLLEEEEYARIMANANQVLPLLVELTEGGPALVRKVARCRLEVLGLSEETSDELIGSLDEDDFRRIVASPERMAEQASQCETRPPHHVAQAFITRANTRGSTCSGPPLGRKARSWPQDDRKGGRDAASNAA